MGEEMRFDRKLMDGDQEVFRVKIEPIRDGFEVTTYIKTELYHTKFYEDEARAKFLAMEFLLTEGLKNGRLKLVDNLA